MNHPNHARWFVKMLDKYLKIDETHAEISKEFTKDRFGVKKNEEKSFVRISIELTLEKTANADVASQQTGTLSFTNSMGNKSFH